MSISPVITTDQKFGDIKRRWYIQDINMSMEGSKMLIY